MPTPSEQKIAAGYATSRPRQTRAERVAAVFRPNARLEQLLRLEQRDPAAFQAIMRDPRQRVAFGYYVESKAAAEAEEGDGAA